MVLLEISWCITFIDMSNIKFSYKKWMDNVYAITLMAFDTKVIQMEKKSALLNFNWHKELAIFLQRR